MPLMRHLAMQFHTFPRDCIVTDCFAVIPGPGPGIHEFHTMAHKLVDARTKCGHDALSIQCAGPIWSKFLKNIPC